MGITHRSGPLRSRPTGPGSGFSVMPKITALQTVDACFVEIKLFKLANALTFLLTLEHYVPIGIME